MMDSAPVNVSTSRRCRWLFLLAMFGLVMFGVWYAYTRPTRTACARWAEIGRPMPEFEAKLQLSTENESFRALASDLQAFGITRLYIPDRFEDMMETPPDPQTYLPLSLAPPSFQKETMAVLTALFEAQKAGQYQDQIRPFSIPTPYMDEHAEELTRFYRRVLQRDVPTWGIDFKQGLGRQRPDILAVRYLSRFIEVDALRRLSLGDRAGAAEAIAANLRITESFRNSPHFFSVSIRSNIESGSARVQVYLPIENTQWNQVAENAVKWREIFLRMVQAHAWEGMHWSKPFKKPGGPLFPNFPGLFPGIKVRTQASCWLDGARIAQAHANAVQLMSDPKCLNVPDLGRVEQDLIYEQESAQGEDFFLRWHNLQIDLLLEEQASVIRITRMRLYAGEEIKPDEFPSGVVPGAHWVVISNREAWTATVQLSNIPAWVTPDYIWLLPLDGSKSWQFAPPPADSPTP